MSQHRSSRFAREASGSAISALDKAPVLAVGDDGFHVIADSSEVGGRPHKYQDVSWFYVGVLHGAIL